MDEHSLSDLVVRVQNGDTEAAGAIYEYVQSRLLLFLYLHVDSREDAEDILHDVFIRFLNRVDTIRQPDSCMSWLYTVALRLASNFRRRRKAFSCCNFDSIASCRRGVVEELLAKEERAFLLEGMDLLRPLDKESLQAFHFNCRSLKQMSQDFSVPLGTIKRRLHVARKRLKEKILV